MWAQISWQSEVHLLKVKLAN